MLEPDHRVPVLRCGHCRRVRVSIDASWFIHPQKFRHEIEGVCRTCMDMLKQAQERAWVRTGRLLLRERQRGYGPNLNDDDVFRGFREGDR